MNLLDHPDARALLRDAELTAADVRACAGQLERFAQR
jgi:hypothetical protein